MRGASVYCCLPKGQPFQSALTRTHTQRERYTDHCVSWQNLTLSWWRGGWCRERGREMKAGFYSAVQPTQQASKGFVKKLLSLSLSAALLFSCSLSKIIILIIIMHSDCTAGVEKPSYSEYCTKRGTFSCSVCTQTHVNRERSETHLISKSIPDKRTNRGMKDFVVRQNVFIKNLHINSLPAPLFWSHSRFSCRHQKKPATRIILFFPWGLTVRYASFAIL